MDFLILGLAVWRISNLFVNEDGPFMMFAEIRRLAGVTYDFESEPIAVSEAGKLLSCVFCCSIWFGVIIAVFYHFHPQVTLLIMMPFALSAGAIAINRWVND